MVLYHSKIFDQPTKSSSQPLIYRHVEIWQVSLHSRLYLANSPQVDLLVWGLLLALLRERFFSAWLSSSSTHSSISTTLALAFPLLLILLWRGYFVDILLHKVPVEYTYTDMYLHILFGRSLCVSAKWVYHLTFQSKEGNCKHLGINLEVWWLRPAIFTKSAGCSIALSPLGAFTCK